MELSIYFPVEGGTVYLLPSKHYLLPTEISSDYVLVFSPLTPYQCYILFFPVPSSFSYLCFKFISL